MRGGALLRLADLRVRQGRFEEAEQLLQGIDAGDAARSRAAVLLARGETALARDVLERALADGDDDATAASPLLALLVEVHLAAGAPDDAHLAVDRLTTLAEHHANRYLRATAALARGRVCLAADEGDPIGCLREALTGFERAQMPMELARTRLELARALRTARPEVALAEARQALAAFERLQATHAAEAAHRLVRSLESSVTNDRTANPLTKREQEVLALLGEGLTNPEIAERLYISRKTVEHHVGSVLSKLGLRSRTEAATHALRAEQGSA